MGYGNGMAGSKRMIRKPVIRRKMYSREFSSFYTNAAANSGDCKMTSVSTGLLNEDGTVTYRKGFPTVTFTSDGGSSFSFSLRSMTSEGVSRGAWAITLS